jgi:hypothetical protein
VYSNEDPGAVRSLIEQTLPAALSDLKHAQESWPRVTDCDRLDAAFEDLNAMGIMARHHWWCCGTCGAGAMSGEFARLQGTWNGAPIVGYVFYHQQDTEIAVTHGDIALNYGSTEQAASEADYEAASVRIAETARAVCLRHGLAVDWDGTYETRPAVRLKWQRRRPPPRFTEAWSNQP